MADRAGFSSTVGHRYYSDRAWLPSGSVPQFHYYGRLFDPVRLPPSSGDILGEFSVKDGSEGGAWRWLPQAQDVTGRVRDRLLEAERLGYPMALLWPDAPPFSIVPPHDPKITEEVAEGIRAFFRSSVRDPP